MEYNDWLEDWDNTTEEDGLVSPWMFVNDTEGNSYLYRFILPEEKTEVSWNETLDFIDSLPEKRK